MSRHPSTPSVYFIYCAGFIKIGFATDLRLRLCGITGSNPHKATILWAAPGDREMERDYHKRFAADRRTGEWFEFSPGLRAFLLNKLSTTVGGVARMNRVESEFRAWAMGIRTIGVHRDGNAG
jgi:hypothetical protein